MSSLVIDANSIRSVARRPGVTRAFPFLKKFTDPIPPSCCGNPGQGPDARPALEAIAKLPADRIRVLKDLVGADTLVVVVIRAARAIKLSL